MMKNQKTQEPDSSLTEDKDVGTRKPMKFYRRWKKCEGKEALKKNYSFEKLHISGHLKWMKISAVHKLVARARKSVGCLKSLTFGYLTGSLDDKGLVKLMSPIIRSFKALRSLDFISDGSREMTDEGFAWLAKSIATHFKQLQSLTMILIANDITDQGASRIAEQLGIYAKNLSHFHFSLEHSRRRMTSKGVDQLAVQIGKHLKQLKSLKLDLEQLDDQTSDSQFIVLMTEIGKGLVNLESFTIDFAGCRKIRGEFGFRFLHEHSFKSLKHLSLNFRLTLVADRGAHRLAEFLGSKNFRQLESLKLGFDICNNISDVGIKAIAEQIGENYVNLRRLSLNFSFYFRVTSQGISELTKYFDGNLRTLEHLNLVFNRCEDMDNEAVVILGTQIRNHLHNIKHLSLNFRDCRGIKDKGVRALMRDVEQMQTLEFLSLKFNKKVTDDVREEVIELENKVNKVNEDEREGNNSNAKLSYPFNQFVFLEKF